MKAISPKHYRILFYASWLLLGAIQATYTELQDDEAYYWVYAHFLDWGYFDHPPMIALLIKCGTFFLGNELGVRLFPLLLNTATLWVTEKLVGEEKKTLFYAICLSLAVLPVIGFMAVPDIPLLFFTAVFFWCYKKFAARYSIKNTLLLAIAAALLLYTKYHGILIIFFTLISNISLFKKWQTYAAGLIALALFVPHLWWQYQHDWISFRYHLFESNVNKYRPSFTLEYLLGQLLIAGPFAGFILWPATFLYCTKNYLERALKFTSIDILIFFFLSSFKGKVEANWTAPALIPLIVLGYHYLVQKEGARKWLYRLLPVTIVLTLLVRFVLIADVLPVSAVVKRYHAWKGWPKEIKNKTAGLPLVFNNSYQRASKTWFYTGQKTYSLNNYRDRRNNYNFWPIEDSLLGKPVYTLDIYEVSHFPDSVQATLWNVGIRYDSSFYAFSKVAFKPLQKNFSIAAKDSLTLPFQLDISPYYRSFLATHPQVDPPVLIGVFVGQKWIKDLPLPYSLQQLVNQKVSTITVQPQLPKGDYILRFAVGSYGDLYTHNSDKILLKIP
ncbi:MAG: glycosyltransferase family 39 protein [Chitinophagaceae bacterium]